MPAKVELDVQSLIEKYESGMSYEDLATAFGISTRTVARHLKAAGIEIRPAHSPRRVVVDSAALKALYESGMGYQAIAELTGIAIEMVRRRLKEAGVTAHPAGQPKGKPSGMKGKRHPESAIETFRTTRRGSNNPAWRGGVKQVDYPSDFTDRLRDEVKARHNNLCVLCETESPLPLHVHHIDWNKLNSDPFNLVPLCHRCHGRVHRVRTAAFYKLMLSHRAHGGQFYDPVVIIKPENVELHPTARVDSFVKIEAAGRVSIGKYVHIASFCHIAIGGGEVILEEGSAMASGAKIIGGSNLLDGESRSAVAPAEQQQVKRYKTVLGKNAVLFTNAVVLPGVTIGEGAALAAGSVATKDIPPGELWGGVPAKFMRMCK